MTETRVLYTGRAHTIGGREGSSRTDDGRLSVELSNPGTKPTGTNPEQLFGVGWSACFLSALQLIATKKKVTFTAPPTDDVEVDLLLSKEDGFSLRVRHNITLPGVDADTARALVEEGHLTCPYSKATRGNIDVETRIL
ncbi:MAG TPA: organic hydroperoxide resistance protein [Polyangiaceae bacterium]|nr:organic hydroperoxide resistance protein [Polyangiaceae bacterium]